MLEVSEITAEHGLVRFSPAGRRELQQMLNHLSTLE